MRSRTSRWRASWPPRSRRGAARRPRPDRSRPPPGRRGSAVLDVAEPAAHERERAVAHRARMRVQLGYHRGEEAAARVDVFLHVPHVVVDEGVAAARCRSEPRAPGRPPARRRGRSRVSIVASCSSSLEPKWAKRPLLLIPTASASRPMESPSMPSTVASCAALRRIALAAALAVAPALAGGRSQIHSHPNIHLLDNLARPFVYSLTARTIVLYPTPPERNDR